MNLLSVKDLSMAFGVESLFEEIRFGVDDGERVGVVGPNGCGKSTLFRILAGRMLPDSGEAAMRTGTTVGFLPQVAELDPDQTPRDVVAKAMIPVREAIAEHDRVTAEMAGKTGHALEELMARQSELQDRIRNLGGWDWEHRVDEMLDRLGVTTWVDRPVRQLSGGQRRRVDLARVLLESPDLLLLDEPTNHLDADAVEWLEGWLKARANTLLLITHDRYFLERVVDRILEIDPEGFFDYPGNYETFMQRKLHRMEVRRKTEHRRQRLLKKELEWLRGGVKARNTRSQKRVKQIEKLREEGPAYEQKKMDMELAEASRLGDVILACRGLDKSYGALTLFEAANFSLRPGDKVGIVGPNGSGKTTLIRMLLGEEKPDAGAVEMGAQTEIGYLRQDELDVDPKMTVYEAMGESDYVWVGDHRYHKRKYLERFLFDHDLQRSQVRLLSGGQCRRFQLAQLVAENANVLVLDEPTNDLDILSLQSLEDALDEFDGCVVAVSHDRYFLNRVCNAIIAVEDHRLVRYEGDYDDYRKAREREERQAKAERDEASKPAAKREKEEPAEKKLTYAERLHLEELEEQIAAVEERKAEIQRELNDPDLYESRPQEIEAVNRNLREVDAQLEQLWDEWAALEERRQC
jgi:ATP-binding cassette subfamily F protein uup